MSNKSINGVTIELDMLKQFINKIQKENQELL